MFSQVSLQSKRNKSKNKPVGPNQIYKLCTAKETKKKTKRQLTEWEKIVSIDATGLNLQNIQATYTTQQPKSQQPNGKMGKRPEQTFFQGKCTDGP